MGRRGGRSLRTRGGFLQAAPGSQELTVLLRLLYLPFHFPPSFYVRRNVAGDVEALAAGVELDKRHGGPGPVELCHLGGSRLHRGKSQPESEEVRFGEGPDHVGGSARQIRVDPGRAVSPGEEAVQARRAANLETTP